MEKLIITITCDSTMSYPHNPHNPTPKGWKKVADEYVRGMLKEKGLTEGSLHSRIDTAAAQHLITADMAAWAHDVRLDAVTLHFRRGGSVQYRVEQVEEFHGPSSLTRQSRRPR